MSRYSKLRLAIFCVAVVNAGVAIMNFASGNIAYGALGIFAVFIGRVTLFLMQEEN